MDSISVELERMATEANAGCGSSYDVFVQRFSGMVDSAYPAGHPDRVRVLELAIPDGYATPEELAIAQEDMLASGYCCHGIDRDCCPAGCGG